MGFGGFEIRIESKPKAQLACVKSAPPCSRISFDVGALIISIGFGRLKDYNYKKEPTGRILVIASLAMRKLSEFSRMPANRETEIDEP